MLQSLPLPTVPPPCVQCSALVARRQAGMRQSRNVSHGLWERLHVPSCLPSPGFGSFTQSCWRGMQQVTATFSPQADPELLWETRAALAELLVKVGRRGGEGS